MNAQAIIEQMLRELEARKKHYEEEMREILNDEYSSKKAIMLIHLKGRVEEIENLIVYVTCSLKEEKK